MSLIGQLANVPDLCPDQIERMYALMDRHYADVRRETFLEDLAEKTWVILLLDRESLEICGFSTQCLLTAEVDGKVVTALFSGDTIVSVEKWGDPALTLAWGRLATSLIDEIAGPLYWFLISKGYKTYRFLPLFFREFYPRVDRPTPPEIQHVLRALARNRWPESYDEASGLLRATGKDRLRPGVADVTPERLRDPHIRYFIDRNPRHAEGEELCCLAPLSRENFTAAAWRLMGRQALVAESSG